MFLQERPAAAAAGPDLYHLQEEQQQHGLRLESFSSNWWGAPELLAALPAHTLTQLHLDPGWSGAPHREGRYRLNVPIAAAAIARLSSLQQLWLADTDSRCINAFSCAAGLTQLSSLTLLGTAGWEGLPEEDEDRGDDDPAKVLQALLAGLLQLRVLRMPTVVGLGPLLSLTHM